jgi:hypothetical protein
VAYAAAVNRDPAELDPAGRRRASRAAACALHAAPTVADLAKQYLEDRRAKGERAQTLAQDEDIVTRIVGPAFGTRKVGDVAAATSRSSTGSSRRHRTWRPGGLVGFAGPERVQQLRNGGGSGRTTASISA